MGKVNEELEIPGKIILSNGEVPFTSPTFPVVEVALQSSSPKDGDSGHRATRLLRRLLKASLSFLGNRRKGSKAEARQGKLNAQDSVVIGTEWAQSSSGSASGNKNVMDSMKSISSTKVLSLFHRKRNRSISSNGDASHTISNEGTSVVHHCPVPAYINRANICEGGLCNTCQTSGSFQHQIAQQTSHMYSRFTANDQRCCYGKYPAADVTKSSKPQSFPSPKTRNSICSSFSTGKPCDHAKSASTEAVPRGDSQLERCNSTTSTGSLRLLVHRNFAKWKSLGVPNQKSGGSKKERIKSGSECDVRDAARAYAVEAKYVVPLVPDFMYLDASEYNAALKVVVAAGPGGFIEVAPAENDSGCLKDCTDSNFVTKKYNGQEAAMEVGGDFIPATNLFSGAPPPSSGGGLLCLAHPCVQNSNIKRAPSCNCRGPLYRTASSHSLIDDTLDLRRGGSAGFHHFLSRNSVCSFADEDSNAASRHHSQSMPQCQNAGMVLPNRRGVPAY